MNRSVYVSEVRHSTQVRSFVPFTAVPEDAGEWVAIVPINRAQYEALRDKGDILPLTVTDKNGSVVV